MSTPNHYATLGVRPTASLDEIRSAYRAAVRRTHPDVADAKLRYRAFLAEMWTNLRRSTRVDAVLTSNFSYYSERELAVALDVPPERVAEVIAAARGGVVDLVAVPVTSQTPPQASATAAP